MKVLLVCISFLSLLALILAQPTINHKVLYEWVLMEYDWASMGVNKEAYEEQGLYIAENCILAGIKQWQDTIYVTIPRWAPGVPATLNKLVVNNGVAMLQPFPPISEQMINTTYGIKNVQDVEIDPYGRMWVIDTGALNFYYNSEYVFNTPRLLIYDLTQNPVALIQNYSFPLDIAQPGSTFLNDIVIDVIRDFAFITNSAGNGGIYVYDLSSNSARFWTDTTTEIEPNGVNFDIVNSGNYTIRTPSDGIALSSDTNTLYYCPLSGFTLYSIPTELLRNFSTTSQQLHDAVFTVGQKLSQSDGIVISDNGYMYYGNIENNALNYWNVSTPLTIATQHFLFENDERFQWQDTFGFDNSGSLLLVSNRLQLMPNSYDFSGNSGSNFRIYSFNIDGYSYMQGALNQNKK